MRFSLITALITTTTITAFAPTVNLVQKTQLKATSGGVSGLKR